MAPCSFTTVPDFVFDGETSRPYTESDAPSPQSNYGRSKLLGEWFAADAPSHYVLRVESLFGGRLAKSSIDRILDTIQRGEPTRVFVDRTVTPSYVVDVVEATVKILQSRPAPGLYHCVNSGTTTWLGVAEEAARLLSLQPTLVPVEAASISFPAKRPRYCALSNEKLRDAGIHMPDWRSALARYVAGLHDETVQEKAPGLIARELLDRYRRRPVAIDLGLPPWTTVHPRPSWKLHTPAAPKSAITSSRPSPSRSPPAMFSVVEPWSCSHVVPFFRAHRPTPGPKSMIRSETPLPSRSALAVRCASSEWIATHVVPFMYAQMPEAGEGHDEILFTVPIEVGRHHRRHIATGVAATTCRRLDPQTVAGEVGDHFIAASPIQVAGGQMYWIESVQPAPVAGVTVEEPQTGTGEREHSAVGVAVCRLCRAPTIASAVCGWI